MHKWYSSIAIVVQLDESKLAGSPPTRMRLCVNYNRDELISCVRASALRVRVRVRVMVIASSYVFQREQRTLNTITKRHRAHLGRARAYIIMRIYTVD